MKNTYHTEIYPNLEMLRTETGIKYLKHLETENVQIFIIYNK